MGPNKGRCPRFGQQDGKMSRYNSMDDVNLGIEEGARYECDGRYEEGNIGEVNIGGGFSEDVEEYCEEGLQVECAANTYAGDV